MDNDMIIGIVCAWIAILATTFYDEWDRALPGATHVEICIRLDCR